MAVATAGAVVEGLQGKGVAMELAANSWAAGCSSVLGRRLSPQVARNCVRARGVKIVHTVRRIFTGCAKVLIVRVCCDCRGLVIW
jgi:hypothetical protein